MISKNAPAAHQKYLAILIDADNAPVAIVESVFEEIAKYGFASTKCIYGDKSLPTWMAGKVHRSTTLSVDQVYLKCKQQVEFHSSLETMSKLRIFHSANIINNCWV